MLNQCQFIGNLGADPEIRTFSNGNKVCNIRLAVSERWKDRESGERREKTEWIQVSIFTEGLIRVAEQYLKKGSKVFISGKMATRRWQDHSGADKYSTEVVLQGFGGTLTMLDGPSGKQGGPGGGYKADPSPDGYGAGRQPSRDLDDDLPF